MSKYQEIVNTIIQQIDTGRLKRGDKLPSVRQLSQTFHCSKDTAQKALIELKYQKYIYPILKSGYYVLEDNHQDDMIPAITPSDYHYLAYENFRTCVNETLIGRENYLFNYYHRQEGLEELTQSLQNLFLDESVYCKQENIVITSGTQQALYILSQMNFPNQKKTILLEQPTYHRMNELVKSQNLPYLTIKRDFEGLDFKRLEKLFKEGDIKFFYTIPRFSNPLGLSYTLKEKENLINLAHKYDVYIIEDDYMADFDKAANVPLHYLDTHDRIIYLKSFSMSLFPALRLGGLVLPKKLRKRFLADKSLIDYDTNLIMQKALSLYIDNGMFAKNKKYLRQIRQQKSLEFKKEVHLSRICIPYHLSQNILTLELPAKLRKSFLKKKLKTVDWLEKNYIKNCPYQYIQLQKETDWKEVIRVLHTSFSQSVQ
ncbi:PLP-dependent aminotransferase family protein [Streptococcus macacae]|uniref:Bacterial regulatory protein, GntR family n=1 Tax=Streptococcus macacae NCTC 11558 TaxID=764298 RepID=G5JU53_9STRE|nr:PLP-dependent aminotransferase family protein [Streptococcus macacae]EHJ51783.1 bacterial regulatory protein, GntR family [Streptococcus macacae NCTC 11558]SUN78418.1 transcriptional regulator/aminotransferase [Streptococcus macacae NCTC 11558]